MQLARGLAVVAGIPLALVAGGVLTGHPAFWAVLVVVELVLLRPQADFARGTGALFYNRRGLGRLERGDAAAASKAFARALRIGRGQPAYVNNLALSLVYTGELGRARELLEPVVARTDLPAPMRSVLMSTWAMTMALLGELEVARAADEDGSRQDGAKHDGSRQDFSVAAWIIAARERRWPFTRSAEIKGAWTSHLYDVLEAFVAGQGYRDSVLDRPMPVGLARALAYQWPEMKAFLGS